MGKRLVISIQREAYVLNKLSCILINLEANKKIQGIGFARRGPTLHTSCMLMTLSYSSRLTNIAATQ
ncbi:uncharacterized protein G2W53_009153 [Senna tora]|uniref:Uncharacterized protein n=1 Tax=Senna tora TaxID=362788 RepID=A0A834WXG7_9FABA|nr:uncharacterized protein G2W53_009153 [Senna tora]